MINKLVLFTAFAILMLADNARAGLPDVLPPAPESSSVNKSRYISFVATNSGMVTAIRVKLVSLYHPMPLPIKAPDFSAFEGQVRWVGAPSDYSEQDKLGTTFRAAKLVCDPYYANWGQVGLVHVYGEAIVPSSSYDVQAVHQLCDPNFEECFTGPLSLITSVFGDVVAPYANQGSQPDFLDIAAIVSKFKGEDGAISKTRAQLFGDIVDPSHPVDFLEISTGVSGFKGQAYSFSGPTNCNP